MIVTEGGRFGGYGLFLSKGVAGIRRGKVVFLYNLLDLKRTVWEGPELKPGKHTIRFDFKYDGPGFGKGGTGVLFVDGKASSQENDGTHDPDHVPGRRRLRRRRGHAHRCRDGRVSLRLSIQVHRQDRQADRSILVQRQYTPEDRKQLPAIADQNLRERKTRSYADS